MAITYQTGTVSVSHVYRTSSGGTVFSANLNTATAFDYFDDTAVINDALYISCGTTIFSKVTFEIGTALAGTGITIVWEYYYRDKDTGAGSWVTIPNSSDETNGFTTTGTQSFKFGLPWWWYVTTINGVTGFWIRARISALTTITEGGANVTTAIAIKNAQVSLTGYTDASPCTPEDIYQYLLTNAPWLNVSKTENHYDFKTIALNVVSRLLVSNCGFETGFTYQGSSYVNPQFNLGVTAFGVKVDGSTGQIGGWAILYFGNNSGWTINSTSFGLYGSYLKFPWAGGYPTGNGEYINSFIDWFNWIPTGAAIVSNCLIKDSGVWIIQGTFPTFLNNSVSIANSGSGYQSLGLVYQNSWTAEGLNYSFEYPSNAGRILYLYQTRINPVWRFIDNRINFPVMADTQKPLHRPYHGELNPTKVWFYDASAGTYADITTACTDATTGDVPVNGDVGDCIYYGATAATYFTTYLSVTSTLGGTNDYVYAFEHYDGSDWVPFSKIWDMSNNFTQTGRIYLAPNIAASLIGNTTINGTYANYVRVRIVAKGTGTPVIDRLRRSGTSEVGGSEWEMYENYNLELIVQDEDGNAIENANCVLSYNGSEIANSLTQEDGKPVWGEQIITSLTNISSTNGYETFIQQTGNLGNELVTNGGFDSIDNWLWGSTWSLVGGVASHSGAWTSLGQIGIIEPNKYYLLTLTVGGSGTLYVYAGTNYIAVSPEISPQEKIILSNGHDIRFATNHTMTVDNISIKEITNYQIGVNSAINTSGYGGFYTQQIQWKPNTTYTLEYNLTLNSGTAPSIDIVTTVFGTPLQTITASANVGENLITFTTGSDIIGRQFLQFVVGSGVATNFSMTGITLTETGKYPCVYHKWYFDPINAYDGGQNIVEDTRLNYDFVVTKTGYETYAGKINMNKTQNLVIELKNIVPAFVTDGEEVVLRNNPDNYANRNTVTIVK